MHPFVHMYQYARKERERKRGVQTLPLAQSSIFSPLNFFFFSSFSMETSPLKFLTYANTSKMIFINLSLERRRGSLGSRLEIHVWFTQHTSLWGDFPKLAGPRSVPGSTTSPPAHHLPSRVPSPKLPPLAWLLSIPALGEGLRRAPTAAATQEPKERKTRGAYQVRARSLAPRASRSSRAPRARGAAWAAAGALVATTEAAAAAGGAAPFAARGVGARALAPARGARAALK